tara:strand:- start:100 stop:819 length:720 start_codon:yes stop_codon:yes gene_type:complete
MVLYYHDLFIEPFFTNFMHLKDIKKDIPEDLYKVLAKDIEELRPAQGKAIKAGLFDEKNLLICTPTASGKTLIAEMALVKNIMEGKGKGIYIVPLRALAMEKYKAFKQRYEGLIRVGIAVGDPDAPEPQLEEKDLIICTSEKIDALLRHHTQWIHYVKTMVVDEIHLLHDPGRGPTLEVVITLLRKLSPHLQIIGLSATIGNPQELSSWLEATLVEDTWRPVKLKQGVYLQGNVNFSDD